MNRLTYREIVALQNQFNVAKTQNQVNDGSVWKWEGSVGRAAMGFLETGVVMLPKEATFDYYGNRLSPRQELKAGTKGTFQNCREFWEKVRNGDMDVLDYLYETFDQINNERTRIYIRDSC